MDLSTFVVIDTMTLHMLHGIILDVPEILKFWYVHAHLLLGAIIDTHKILSAGSGSLLMLNCYFC